MPSKPMKVVILAGGEGTRLRPLTYTIPKPLIPVKEKPILELLLRQLSRAGLKDIILSTGYRAELIESYFGNGKGFGVNIEYVREKRPLGTAGVLGLLRNRWTPKDAVLVMNGDIVTTLPFLHLQKFHQSRGADLTVAVKRIGYRLPYGVVHTGKKDVLERIAEKPRVSFEICAGIYVMQAKMLKLIPRGDAMDMPQLIDAAIKQQATVLRYAIRGYWKGVESLTQIEEVRQRIQGRLTLTHR